jgi:hypothetical protein
MSFMMQEITDNPAREDNEFDKILQNERQKSNKTNNTERCRQIFAVTVGGLSAYFSFGKTSIEGASLIPMPLLDLQTKINLSIIGGSFLNGVLNAYFTNLAIRNTQWENIKNDKARYTAIGVFTSFSSIPFVATAVMNNEPLPSIVVVAIAYSMIHFLGSEFIIKKINCSNNNSREHNDYSLLDNAEGIKIKITEIINKMEAMMNRHYSNTKSLPNYCQRDLRSLDDYKTLAHNLQENQHSLNLSAHTCPPFAKKSIWWTLYALNMITMICALPGYYKMTQDETDEFFHVDVNGPEASIGAISFGPFIGIILLVLNNVTSNIVNLVEKRSMPYYMQNNIIKGAAIIGCALSFFIGLFSTATCAFLTAKYFDNSEWYAEFKLTITLAAMFSTSLFNTYPTIDILCEHILKPLATKIDSNVKTLHGHEQQFKLFKQSIEGINNEELSAVHRELSQANATLDINNDEVKDYIP